MFLYNIHDTLSRKKDAQTKISATWTPLYNYVNRYQAPRQRITNVNLLLLFSNYLRTVEFFLSLFVTEMAKPSFRSTVPLFRNNNRNSDSCQPCLMMDVSLEWSSPKGALSHFPSIELATRSKSDSMEFSRLVRNILNCSLKQMFSDLKQKTEQE